MDEHEPACTCNTLRAERTRTCGDELAVLIELSGRAIIEITGPTFPYLAPKDAGRALLRAATVMPAELRLRTLGVAVDLLHTEDWMAEIGTAASHGDPMGRALEVLLAEQEFGATAFTPPGRFLH